MKAVIIFVKDSILDIWLSSQNVSKGCLNHLPKQPCDSLVPSFSVDWSFGQDSQNICPCSSWYVPMGHSKQFWLVELKNIPLGHWAKHKN